MIRISFRHSMFAGFLLIVALLSGTTICSWLLLEQFVEQSQRASKEALQLNTATQELTQRTIDLERAIRQYAVLNDDSLLQRIDENLTQARDNAKRLAALPDPALGTLPNEWQDTASVLNQSLHASAPLPALLTPLSQLHTMNASMAQRGHQWIDEQDATLRAELKRSRLRFTTLLAATVIGAFLVAVAMSWWLTRPIAQLEHSIERMGAGRFSQRFKHEIDVRGPDDLRQIGRRLEWLRGRLDELESGRERTLRHVSHELKTPLTALREGIALLEEEVVGRLDAGQREIVDILQHNVLTLQRHIESLLRLNAVTLEASHLNLQPLNINALLNDVIRYRDLQLQARGLHVDCQAPAITRTLDGEKLRVIIDNLLSNAIDFSPEGSTIRLNANLTDKRLRITCADEGPGIAPEDAERIFEPFTQGIRPPPTPRQGSGIGLSIVREMTSAMGGTITVLPGAGGAMFQLEISCDA